MNEYTQTLAVFGALVTALVAVLATAVGALCYFLRCLVNRTIPQQGERFERVMMAQLDEARKQREQCHAEHESQEQKASQRHSQIMQAIEGRAAPRPFDPLNYGGSQ